MYKIKIFEEYFWEFSDNDVAKKIIKKIEKNFNIKQLQKTEEWTYSYNIIKNDNDDDPYGEENWDDDVSIIAIKDVVFGNPFLVYEVFVIKGDKKIKLKTNYAYKIYRMLRNRYKNNDRNNNKKFLNDIFDD